jgi:peptidoglycan-N-acetylglucosamine deacetylase
MLKANTPARLEEANHGWNHEDFSAHSLQKQIELMQKTNEKIRRILDINPTVFIAPFNKIHNSAY